MTTIDVRPVLGGNTNARIKLPNGEYTATCGRSEADQPNDRGVGHIPSNDSKDPKGNRNCNKLGFVVLESNETNHYIFKRRQTTILQKNGEVSVYNDGANILEGATKRTYTSLGKSITPQQMAEIERIQKA
jgi:hypothetical protein